MNIRYMKKSILIQSINMIKISVHFTLLKMFMFTCSLNDFTFSTAKWHLMNFGHLMFNNIRLEKFRGHIQISFFNGMLLFVFIFVSFVPGAHSASLIMQQRKKYAIHVLARSNCWYEKYLLRVLRKWEIDFFWIAFLIIN